MLRPLLMKRSNEQKEAHQQQAKKLLDMGLQKADVAATLQRKYGLSRATSYRIIDEADISRCSEDPSLQADPIQDYARLVREYERLARMGGLSQKF